MGWGVGVRGVLQRESALLREGPRRLPNKESSWFLLICWGGLKVSDFHQPGAQFQKMFLLMIDLDHQGAGHGQLVLEAAKYSCIWCRHPEQNIPAYGSGPYDKAEDFGCLGSCGR